MISKYKNFSTFLRGAFYDTCFVTSSYQPRQPSNIRGSAFVLRNRNAFLTTTTFAPLFLSPQTLALFVLHENFALRRASETEDSTGRLLHFVSSRFFPCDILSWRAPRAHYTGNYRFLNPPFNVAIQLEQIALSRRS